ncbi:MAG: energy-coupling factor transporter ATPase [Thermoleophilia bacterium]
MENPIISCRGLGYRYPHSLPDLPALAGIDLEVVPGELIALIGANGSGKSTLARLFNGLLLPSSGSVIVKGRDTRERDNIDAVRETVGMVFQNPESQIVANSVEDDIAFGLENIGLPVEEIERRIETALEAFGLTELRDREPHWLSGGQKQRTVLAGVMALEPDVLVLDEPTSMLDPRSQKDFREIIEGLRSKGTTIIYITHAMQEVVGADRVVVLKGGGIAATGGPREVFTDEALLADAGLLPPLPVRLSRELIRRGLEVPLALTIEELVT